MSKRIILILLSLIFVLIIVGCGTKDGIQTSVVKEVDLYIGEYASNDEIEGELNIRKSEGKYEIFMEFEETIQIIAVGNDINGTIYYEGNI